MRCCEHLALENISLKVLFCAIAISAFSAFSRCKQTKKARFCRFFDVFFWTIPSPMNRNRSVFIHSSLINYNLMSQERFSLCSVVFFLLSCFVVPTNNFESFERIQKTKLLFELKRHETE